jgi:excisionase family DNA binding protein
MPKQRTHQHNDAATQRARRRTLTLDELALRYLVPKETIAERYSVSPRTIEFWVRKRRIPCIKVGRQLLFNIADCDKAVRRFQL